MPSRRRVIHALAAGVTLTSGCSQTETTSRETSVTETTELSPVQKQTSTKTETPTETQTESQCTGSWESDRVWDFDGQGDLNSVIAGHRSIFALFEESVAALDPTTGERKWQRAVGELDGIGLQASSFRTDAGVIVCGSRRIAAVEPETGELRWSYAIPGREETAGIQATAIHDGTVYVGAVNADTPSFEASDPYARIYSLNTTTGEHRTFVELSGEPNPPDLRNLVADGNGVYVDVGDRLASFDLDGQERWNADVSSASTPALQGNIIIVPTESSLVALGTSSGSRIWTNTSVHRAVTIENESAYAPVQSNSKTGIATIRLQDGTVAWETNTLAESGRPIVRDGIVYVPVDRAEASDLLTAVDSRSGCRIGSLEFESGPLYGFGVGTKRVFTIVGVTDGRLRVYDLPESKS